MAARRLVIVMLVMLGISTLAAALVPTDPEQRSEPTTTAAPAKDGPRGRLIRRTVEASGSAEVVRMQVGDQLQLRVTARRADQVEIDGLGELEEVDPSTPANFDLLPFEPGAHPIRLLDARRTVARIVVSSRRRKASLPRTQAERRSERR